ncbi:hypothetical protein [Leucothrix arctica]|uniref:Uncharacterized protein n=1 Tax=Leucothrix arctica TaxID=1481894 RepID=A0A317C3M7_9GAMM|nr:hypothetical protein [Leucothrix arctica]PWQ93188.1 hypothetical protein DKT75_21110 [Leucothrix arctica]
MLVFLKTVKIAQVHAGEEILVCLKAAKTAQVPAGEDMSVCLKTAKTEQIPQSARKTKETRTWGGRSVQYSWIVTL